MLFVSIACGAISGWHSLVGSIGTARQLEYETDALPVGGGGMFTENALALLALVAVSIAAERAQAPSPMASAGCLDWSQLAASSRVTGPRSASGVFVVIVLTMVQLVFRVMRVTLGEWLGDPWLGLKNPHSAAIISMGLTPAAGAQWNWIYLSRVFGASNQLMAALSLLIVRLWLRSVGRSPRYAFWPMSFMYTTTMRGHHRNRIQPVRQHLVESADRLADHQYAGRGGDDRGRHPAVCSCVDYCLRRLARLGTSERPGAGAADGGGLRGA